MHAYFTVNNVVWRIEEKNKSQFCIKHYKIKHSKICSLRIEDVLFLCHVLHPCVRIGFQSVAKNEEWKMNNGNIELKSTEMERQLCRKDPKKNLCSVNLQANFFPIKQIEFFFIFSPFVFVFDGWKKESNTEINC